MKESEISNLPPPAPGATQGPCYRYFSNPPATISLRLADIASQLPEAVRLPAFNAEHRIELPCADVFAGPVPKLMLSRLAKIANEHVRLDGAPDSPIRLPVAQLALGYHFISGRELLEGPESKNTGEVSQSPEDFAPKGDKSETEESPAEGKGDIAQQKWEAPLVEAMSPPTAAEAPVSGPFAPSLSAADEPTVGSAQAVESGAPLSPENEAPLTQESQPPTALESSLEGTPAPAVPEAWRPISSFPTFRRKVVGPEGKSPASPPPVDFPKPRGSFDPPEFSSRPPEAVPSESGAEAELEAVEQPAEEFALAAPTQEAILVETEHLPKSELQRTVEIPDQDGLQAVFMTEEFLSVDRVVELCGGLPGIKSCVLAHGSAVLASHNVPESIDLVSLSAHALEMLAAMRQSAARMAIGAVPAVTIHSEKGPITFFHRDDLCLLVLHKDRGFVPGVREKLQQVVEHLSEANFVLPAGDSRPALPQKEPAF